MIGDLMKNRIMDIAALPNQKPGVFTFFKGKLRDPLRRERIVVVIYMYNRNQ